MTNTQSPTCFITGYHIVIQGDAETTCNVLHLLPLLQRLHPHLVSGFLAVSLSPLCSVDRIQYCIFDVTPFTLVEIQ